MSALGPRAGGLRLIRVVLVLIAVGVVLNTTGVVITLFLNADRAAELRDVAVQTSRNAEQTRGALCALRADLERRSVTSRAFLREHPNGIPGISAKVIRDGIRNQERTVRALAGIDC